MRHPNCKVPLTPSPFFKSTYTTDNVLYSLRKRCLGQWQQQSKCLAWRWLRWPPVQVKCNAWSRWFRFGGMQVLTEQIARPECAEQNTANLYIYYQRFFPCDLVFAWLNQDGTTGI